MQVAPPWKDSMVVVIPLKEFLPQLQHMMHHPTGLLKQFMP